MAKVVEAEWDGQLWSHWECPHCDRDNETAENIMEDGCQHCGATVSLGATNEHDERKAVLKALPPKVQKAEWKDNHKNNSSEIQIGLFRLVVHHWVGCGDDWFTSCNGIFKEKSLKATSLDDAKEEALNHFKNTLQSALSTLH